MEHKRLGNISIEDIHRFYCDLSARVWEHQPKAMFIYTEDDVYIIEGDKDSAPICHEHVTVSAAYIRSLIKEHYDVEFTTKIKKIGFDLGNNIRPYFTLYDSWRPPQEPKTKYELVTSEVGSDYIQHMRFETLRGLMDAFQICQVLDRYHITAYENDIVIQEYIPKEKRL